MNNGNNSMTISPIYRAYGASIRLTDTRGLWVVYGDGNGPRIFPSLRDAIGTLKGDAWRRRSAAIARSIFDR